jgi:hypothetical protein
MVWGAVIAATAAIVSAQQQNAAAVEWVPIRGIPDPEPQQFTPGEPCQGCGSRETLIHRGARKCAYCRSDR